MGGTDIYYAAMEGLRQLKNYDLSPVHPCHHPADGRGVLTEFSDFRDGYEAFGADAGVLHHVRLHPIPTQLEASWRN